MDTKTPKAASTSEGLSDLMRFVEFTNQFRAIQRTVWFKGVNGPERDGEHSFQIALCGWYANDRLKLGLDTGRIIGYAMVHDLSETYAEETPAFPDLQHELPAPSHRTKKRRERAAFARIESEWGGSFPDLIEYMRAYEAQSDEESRFVSALEKLVVTINIYQDDGRTYHRVGCTFEELDAYKTCRVGKHLAVRELYNEMRELLRARKHELFPPILSKRISQ